MLRGSSDQRIRGSEDQKIRVSEDQRIRGSEDQREEKERERESERPPTDLRTPKTQSPEAGKQTAANSAAQASTHKHTYVEPINPQIKYAHRASANHSSESLSESSMRTSHNPPTPSPTSTSAQESRYRPGALSRKATLNPKVSRGQIRNS